MIWMHPNLWLVGQNLKVKVILEICFYPKTYLVILKLHWLLDTHAEDTETQAAPETGELSLVSEGPLWDSDTH